MDREKRCRIPSFNSYYRCAVCGEVVYSPGWRISLENTTTLCCGSEGKNKAAWPPLQVSKLLELASQHNLNIRDEAGTAVILLCSAMDMLIDPPIQELLKLKMDTNLVEEIIPEICVGEYYRIKLYDRISAHTLESLFYAHGLKSFLQGWSFLIKARNCIVRGQPGQNLLQETETIKMVRENCLKAFALVQNDVLQQLHKSIKQKTVTSASKAALLVDDEDVVTKHLGRFMEKHGVKVFTAGTGKDALDIYKTHRPSCVFLDMGLPDMDGFNVLERIREIDPKASVYFITGIDGEAFSKEAKRLGAAGHFTKPINLSEIMGVLQHFKTQ